MKSLREEVMEKPIGVLIRMEDSEFKALKDLAEKETKDLEAINSWLRFVGAKRLEKKRLEDLHVEA